ncbi:MAG TPA: ScyD/ScyE family protein [Pyrinomonadaceae bacterium]|nr:ScyD/ScyE family protein [Pyrinomonadaceae bacterium]
MMSKKSYIPASVIALVLVLAFAEAKAQTASVFTTGLSQPAKIMLTPEGNLLVTETLGPPNSGRVSIIDHFGNRRTLIDGLPSGISAEGPSGPSGLDMRGRTLFVSIGEGNGTLPGPIPGTELPNPNPSSPLLSSVLAIQFSAAVEKSTQGLSLTYADQLNLAAGGDVTLGNGAGDKITIELVADFPNSVAAPLPFFAPNVRHSNPFALCVAGKDLYVADGGMNSVIKVNIATGNTQTITTFPPKPNPLPFGPPVIEAVPDGIQIVDGQLLVTLLTGFPFVPGLSEVRRVDVATGSSTTFINSRSSAIDVVGGKSKGAAQQYYVLEFSTDFLANAPGQLLSFQSQASAPTVVAGGLITPSGMARDSVSGDIYIAEIFTGRIIKVKVP